MPAESHRPGCARWTPGDESDCPWKTMNQPGGSHGYRAKHAPSVWTIHNPRISFSPVMLMPRARYTALARTAPASRVADL